MTTCLDCKDGGIRGCDVRNSPSAARRGYIICADFKPKNNYKGYYGEL